MKRGLYLKLAVIGISKNRKLYFPYILTCICMVMMFYIISFLRGSEEFRQIHGGESLQSILSLGMGVMGIFSLILLSYTNSFLIRKRQREFGLYHILGMGKKNLVKILFLENVITAVVSIVSGLAAGVLFSKIAELLAVKILKQKIGFELHFEPKATVLTVIIFAGIFLLLLLRMLVYLLRTKPVEMLKSENIGEKPPKANWILAILGVIILAAAYWLAVSIEDPLTAMMIFMVAVVMVIVATYLLFVAGSVAFCKMMQKKKGYYYKTNHFISLSSMIYRMKRNGAGLASICILSTMVLVMVSSTVSLYIGMDDSLKRIYPVDMSVSILNVQGEAEQEETNGDKNSDEKLQDLLEQTVASQKVEMVNQRSYNQLRVSGLGAEDQVYFDTSKADSINLVNTYENLKVVYVYSQEECGEYLKGLAPLQDDEAYLYVRGDKGYPYDTLTLENCGKWKIRQQLSEFDPAGPGAKNMNAQYYLVVKDTKVIEQIEQGEREIYGENASDIIRYYDFDLNCDENRQIEVEKVLWKEITKAQSEDVSFPQVFISCRAAVRSDYYGVYGGLFFLGVILGTVFIFGMVLIIYYKQISEGYEDQKRFEILMKVGMSRKEVRKSINSQVLTVFFMPLIVAGIHVLFAFPLISKTVALMTGIEQDRLLFSVTAVCFVVFAVFYLLVYLLTSREYYKIVSGGKEE